MTRLYIIGPVTGMPYENFPAFDDARLLLSRAGYYVNIPHSWIIAGSEWHSAMAESIRRMMAMWADSMRQGLEFGIAMLPGWEDSKGAKIEHDLAEALGIPCKTVEEWSNEDV